MSFHVEELLRIKQATSGPFKKKARRAVADALTEFHPKVVQALSLQGEAQQVALQQLTIEAVSRRQAAFESGAYGYGQAEWAAAAACESWVLGLATGTSESMTKVDMLIMELCERA